MILILGWSYLWGGFKVGFRHNVSPIPFDMLYLGILVRVLGNLFGILRHVATQCKGSLAGTIPLEYRSVGVGVPKVQLQPMLL